MSSFNKMEFKMYYLIGFLLLLSGCADQAQTGHMRYAMEMLGKCNFVEAIDASNDAIRMGNVDEKAYIASIAINAKSHEIQNQPVKADEAYLLLMDTAPKITSIEQAKSVVNNLNTLIKDCANI